MKGMPCRTVHRLDYGMVNLQCKGWCGAWNPAPDPIVRPPKRREPGHSGP